MRKPDSEHHAHPAAAVLLTCRNCGRELPAEQFERYPTGTFRLVCRQCKYQLYGKRAKAKWRMKRLLTKAIREMADETVAYKSHS